MMIRPYLLVAFGALCLSMPACLDRPVVAAAPKTHAVHSERIRQSSVDKIDLLFMIDNSASMADKQEVLAEAVPDLLDRLVNPACVRLENGQEQWVEKLPDGSCPEGSEYEFEPIKDIHIGVISSSLGGNGSDSCATKDSPSNDDRGHLLSRRIDGSTIPTYAGKGFLQWDADGKLEPEGFTDQAELSRVFKDMVIGVDQVGCGYEQSLEAVYRFLVDPEPYKEIQLVHEEGRAPAAHLVDVDEKLLQQRADFLRPDSLVAIVSLSDENDCSTIAGDRWYTSLQSRYGIPRANSACAENPHDECCGPCRGWQAPAHCLQPADDPACQVNDGRWDTASRPPEIGYNLRCFDQKRRFGIDFLYPTQRYIDAIQQRVVPNRHGEMVANPLFTDLQCQGTNCKPERDPSLLYWAMIVGVPWQDIAKDPTDLSKGYMSADELESEGRWNVILGDPAASPPVLPLDPLMIESIDPRTGDNPITGDVLVAPDPAQAPSRYANPINGHERLVLDRDDLQYACIFDLKEPRLNEDRLDEDCHQSAGSQNPLCQDENGEFGLLQYAAKAYPGTRHLEVAKGLGNQAIVASICPANLHDPTAPDYGYRPAVGAIIERLKKSLRTRCLPRALEPSVCVPEDDPTYGQVPCLILEVRNLEEGETCSCDMPGRAVPNPEAVTDDVREAGDCVCEITQLGGEARTACASEVDTSKIDGDGWCYVDPAQELGNPEIVEKCPATERRLIRFVNEGNAQKDALVFITCQEAAFNPGATGDDALESRCSEN